MTPADGTRVLVRHGDVWQPATVIRAIEGGYQVRLDVAVGTLHALEADVRAVEPPRDAEWLGWEHGE